MNWLEKGHRCHTEFLLKFDNGWKKEAYPSFCQQGGTTDKNWGSALPGKGRQKGNGLPWQPIKNRIEAQNICISPAKLPHDWNSFMNSKQCITTSSLSPKTLYKHKKFTAIHPPPPSSYFTFNPITFWPFISQMLCSVRSPFLAAELSFTIEVIFPFLNMKPTCPVLSLCMVIIRSKGLKRHLNTKQCFQSTKPQKKTTLF